MNKWLNRVLEKARGKKDITKLVKKQIVNKRGKRTTVWVKREDGQGHDKSKTKTSQKIRQLEQENKERGTGELQKYFETKNSEYLNHGEINDILFDAQEKQENQEEGYNYDNVGVRIVDSKKEKHKIGDVLGPSRIWDDNVPTDQYLNGTSAVMSYLPREEVGGYVGDTILIIGSDNVEGGEDPGEGVFIRPKVIDILYTKPKSELEKQHTGKWQKTGNVTAESINAPAIISDGEFDKITHAPYFRDGEKVASSRTTPWTGEKLPDGTIKWDNGESGNSDFSVDVLVTLDANDPRIVAGEETAESKKGDIDTFAKWMEEGRTPPPVSALENRDGKIQIIDGHRRWYAAQRAGKPIQIWVNPDNGSGSPMTMSDLKEQGGDARVLYRKFSSGNLGKAFGKKDVSKLIKKQVIDKRGRRTTVYVAREQLPFEFMSKLPKRRDYKKALAVEAIRSAVIDRYGSNLATIMQKQYQSSGHVALIDQPVKDHRDVAYMCQQFRDNKMETFRIIFTQGGTVAAHVAMSSRLPGVASAIPRNYDPDTFFDRVKFLADAFEADGFYISHNHPSGSSAPSPEDVHLTKYYHQKFGKIFKGHVIIDHNEWTTISPLPGGDGLEVKRHAEDLRARVAETEKSGRLVDEIEGSEIFNVDDVAALTAKMMSPGKMVLIGTARSDVVSVHEIPLSMLRFKLPRVKALISYIGKRLGITNFFIGCNKTDVVSAWRKRKEPEDLPGAKSSGKLRTFDDTVRSLFFGDLIRDFVTVKPTEYGYERRSETRGIPIGMEKVLGHTVERAKSYREELRHPLEKARRRGGTGMDDVKQRIIEFFAGKRKIRDADIHALAERLDMDPDKLEERIYEVLRSFLGEGKAVKEKAGDPDPVQLLMGIEIEREHTSSAALAERIARDHLAEIPDYYTRLKGMEKEALGKARKLDGRMDFQGLDISIENRKGSYREGVDADGHKWRTYMNYPYGYIRMTRGADGDHLDCYIGPDQASDRVFVVHQNDPVTGKYDEDKVMLGFEDGGAAKAAYLKQYDRPGFFGDMIEMSVDEFREKAYNTLKIKNDGAGRKISKAEIGAVIAVEILKAFKKKDISKLVKKQIIDKHGKRTTVWVRRGEEVKATPHVVQEQLDLFDISEPVISGGISGGQEVKKYAIPIGRDVVVNGINGKITGQYYHAETGEMLYNIRDESGKTHFNMREKESGQYVFQLKPEVRDKIVEKEINSATPETRAVVQKLVFGTGVGETKAETETEKKAEAYQYAPETVDIAFSKLLEGQSIYGRPTSVKALDYTGVKPKLCRVMDVAEAAAMEIPSWMPKINEQAFSGLSGKTQSIDVAKIGENRYLVSLSGSRKSMDEDDYAVVSMDVLALMYDFYKKRLRKRLEEDRVEDMKRREKQWEEWGYSEETKERWRKEYSKFRMPAGVGLRKMTRTHFKFIQMVTGDLRRGPTWEHHREIMDDLRYKINDMKIQREFDTNTYSKGEETSYGPTGTRSELLDTHGVFVKRQNGKPVEDEVLASIKDTLDQVYKVFGDRSSMSKKYGLKISFSGEKAMHARKFAGLFHPTFHAIGVSELWGKEKGKSFTLAHEYAHFMDSWLGDRAGFHYNSDNYASAAGQIAREFRSSMSKAQTSDYTNRTTECFARALEQYFSIKTGDEDYYQEVHNTRGDHPTPSVYREKILPLVEKFFRENEELLKAMPTPWGGKN